MGPADRTTTDVLLRDDFRFLWLSRSFLGDPLWVRGVADRSARRRLLPLAEQEPAAVGGIADQVALTAGARR
jgi:hypothetical protein